MLGKRPGRIRAISTHSHGDVKAKQTIHQLRHPRQPSIINKHLASRPFDSSIPHTKSHPGTSKNHAARVVTMSKEHTPLANGNGADKAAAGGGCLAGLKARFPFLQRRRNVVLTVAAVVLVVGGGLAGLAALHRGGDGGGDGSVAAASDTIGSDDIFAGQSPPVYPSRESRASPNAALRVKKSR
jgi:hypothetical protein